LGYEPIEQRGVYGGSPEPSYLVPGLTSDLTRQLGREFEQEAVISAGGWHRLADDATFPRQSVGFPEQVDDFYSEVTDPASGQPLRYQLGFPDEAFGPPAPPTVAEPSGVPSAPISSGMEKLSPSPQDNTAPALVRMPSQLVKGMGNLARGIRKTAEPGVYELHPQVKERVFRLFEIGSKMSKQADWSGVNEEMIAAFDGDVEAATKFFQLWGATSPNTSVPRNTQEAVSSQIFTLEKPGKLMTLHQARTLKPMKITMAGAKVPNINLALQGQPLGSPKVDRMGRFMVGEDGALPLDVHTLYGLGSKHEKFAEELPGLRAKMTKAEGLPLRGSLSEEDIYERVESALNQTLEELQPGLAHNPTFATFWEGVRAHKGLKPQGGPIDILRKKGLLKEMAMLDPGKLRAALKTAGWTAGAITAVLKASSAEAQPVGARSSRAVNPEPGPQEDRQNPRPSVREWAKGNSRETDIELPGTGNRAKTAAPMNARVKRPA
jgi:hypothetical protein